MMSVFRLPNLTYNYNALEPFLDAETMEIHHQKHHQTYVNNLNNALTKHLHLNYSLEEMLMNLNLLPKDIQNAVNNNGGGHFNHSFFWKILKLNNKYQEENSIIDAINKQFHSLENFKNLFAEAAKNIFGSGWAWLILNTEKKIQIITTPNQNTPLTMGIPILGLDVWEHAYYLSYRNRRIDYIEAFFNIINWQQVENNFQTSLLK